MMMMMMKDNPIVKWTLSILIYGAIAVGIWFYIGKDAREKITNLITYKLTATAEQKARDKAQDEAENREFRIQARFAYVEGEVEKLLTAERTGIYYSDDNEYNLNKNDIEKLWNELRKNYADIFAQYDEKGFKMLARLAYVESKVADLMEMEKTGKMWAWDKDTLTKEDIEGFWNDLQKEYPDVFANYEEMKAARKVYREQFKREAGK